ncbi:dienelactone hydrolase family protein [Litchfieldia alkalitelluris]|uniref:dienelactone hydrolase family protein n=1 Tax=Litchfieldia alkalitelluris TaxID=304268 RepID=UPI000998A9C7|nr:alpha/beta hydrolase family protein [Litchfieldia alkalitelluris]
MTETDLFLEQMYADTTRRHQGMFTKSDLLRSLGTFSKPCTVNDAIVLETKEFAEYTREKVLIPSTNGLKIPMYILTPKENHSTYPAVLALHGHGYGVREIVGLREDGTEDEGVPGIHQHFAVNLVKRGLKVFAPEVIAMGERRLQQDLKAWKSSSCYTLSTHLLMAGKTLAGLRVFEAGLVLDFISNQHDVNLSQIGVMGFSGGGLIAAYTAALDERVKSTVICGFTSTFQGSILATDHCLCNYIPGILTAAELPEIISLIAPRKLFVESGTRDPIFPLQHVEQAIAVLENKYSKLGNSESFAWDIFVGKHEISGRKSYDWLKNSLLKD